MTLSGILVAALCGWGCHTIAKCNGRNTMLATSLGVLFNIFAIIGYLVIGRK